MRNYKNEVKRKKKEKKMISSIAKKYYQNQL